MIGEMQKMNKMKEVIVFVVSHMSSKDFMTEKKKTLIFEGLSQTEANQAANVFHQRTGMLASIHAHPYQPTDHT